MGRVGFEHPPQKASKTPISEDGGAKSDAHRAPEASKYPDFSKVMEVWPKLPEHIKAAIKVLVQIYAKESESCGQ
jgi:hypothetical protein